MASESGTSRFENDFYFGFLLKLATIRDGLSNRYLAGLYFFQWRVFFAFEMERREYKSRISKKLDARRRRRGFHVDRAAERVLLLSLRPERATNS
jgi:hypothetical protein